MRYFKSITQPLENNLNFQSIIKVEQLTNFDMIYVYHLLTKGVKLKLIKS